VKKIKVLDWYYKNDKNQSKTAKKFENKFPGLTIKIAFLLVSAISNMVVYSKWMASSTPTSWVSLQWLHHSAGEGLSGLETVVLGYSV
jgi:hypothetical protein